MSEDLLIEAKEFFELYKQEIGKGIKKGEKVIQVSFQDLASFSHTLADQLLQKPEEITSLLEIALDEIGLVSGAKVRLIELPASQQIPIRQIRARHLEQFIVIEGIVRQASDVRPQVVNAKFECPSCGTIISVLQIEKRFREPMRCSCGRKTGFKLISKEMVDAQRLVIEESPENLSGGEQPRRLNVFLKEDLVDPKMEERTTPGSRVRVNGILKEIPVPLATGAISTRFDLALEANSIIPLEESFEELDVSEEEERQIRELATDPEIYNKLAGSIAPSIFGYERYKLAIALQLLGGVRKKRSDGTFSRGDIHILLVGDPGVAKSVMLKFISSIAPKGRYIVGKAASLNYDEPLLIRKDKRQKFVKIGEFVDSYYKGKETGFVPCSDDIEALSLNLDTLKLEWKPIRAVFRHKNSEDLLIFFMETGRKITITSDHSVFCIENGEIKCKPSQELKEGDYVLIPKKIPSKELEFSNEIAKFLGYFIAEGHLYNRKGSYKVQFTLNKNENDIISDIRIISQKYFGKQISVSPHGENAVRITIYGKEPYLKVCSWLGNLSHKKAKEKGVPETILNSNINARKEFFDSYIKGDYGVTKSERLMSELLNLKLQDNIIASCLEREEEGSNFLENGRKIVGKGKRFDLIAPTPKKEFQNMKLNFPIKCLPDNLKIFFKRKLKQRYSRINLNRIDKSINFKRILKIYEEKKARGKKLRELFGENSLEYFSNHSELFSKKKIGREIEISLTKKGMEIGKNIIKLKKFLESDIAFVKIKKIEKIKPQNEFVYDISTPKNENFVGGFGGVICHNTGAGLTATVVKDEFLRGWALEAGAMVLANKGVACLDELEKMSEEDRSAMHEALEQQTVTISKANVQATLRAETSVLGAANPKFGRFDLYQPVAQQIEMAPALINRFDLIFIMKDMPERSKDEAIATHVLLEHRKAGARPPIEPELLKKYISYAKQKVFPQLTDKAVEEIKNFYVELRNAPAISDDLVKPIPISARQLEALIRLSEASARARLSKKITKEDAKRAIEIMHFYLLQVGFDKESGTIDIDRIATGVPASERNRIILVREALIKLESRTGKLIPLNELTAELAEKIPESEIEEAVDKLKRSGDIFEPRKGFVQRI